MALNLYELRELRNKNYVFRDRFAAGRILASMISPDFPRLENGIVLAIPSGGVPVGLEVSRHLTLPFDMIIVRKLQIPGNTEAGFGAMSLDGEIFLNENMLPSLHLSRQQIDKQVDKVRRELKDRNDQFRENRPLPELAGKTVILTDDGLASGYTMLTAVNDANNRGANRIIVAVPTAPLATIRKISPKVDLIYCANVQEYGPFAVANAYEHWHDLSREEVLDLVKEKV